MISCSVKSRTVLRVISWVPLSVKSIRASKVLPPDKISAAPTLISRESLAGDVAVTLEPLQTSDAHSYWRTFVAGRTDLPTRDLKVHLDRFLALPPEDQRSHFSGQRDGRRSAEHTSELQAPCNLGCRLLLVKRNKHIQ